VFLAFRSDRDAAEAVALECIEAGVMAFTVQADVAVEMDVIDLFEQAEQFGPLGGLVNNAGVISPVGSGGGDGIRAPRGGVRGSTCSACFFCCREAVRRMQANGQWRGHRQTSPPAARGDSAGGRGR